MEWTRNVDGDGFRVIIERRTEPERWLVTLNIGKSPTSYWPSSGQFHQGGLKSSHTQALDDWLKRAGIDRQKRGDVGRMITVLSKFP